METKNCIRKRILAVRNQMTEKERLQKSRQIMEKFSGQKAYHEADILLGFVGYGSEVDTLALLEQAVWDGKKVYCPVSAADGTMEFYRFTSKQELTAGYKNIPEPKRTAEVFSGNKDKVCMLMPGVAFDKMRNRIGYGKGFYDRYLHSFMPEWLIAVCFECQITDKIPAEKQDVVPHMLLTESRMY